MLELQHASKDYVTPGGAIHAVNDVSMSVSEGEVVAIFGPSGSGKTTLLLLAAGLLRASAGSVRFEGQDLNVLPKREILSYRRTKLGLVFQGFNLAAGLTAEENVAMPLLLRGVHHREARERALAALDDVGLRHRAEHMPEQLSGGEQQRVAIGRALVGEPKLILADEPTGNLDSETGETVLKLLSVLPRARGAATILVTHDARVAAYADLILGMRDGQLTEPDLQTPVAISP
jgi:putative ABC transport system ATP-binding protein